MGHHRHISSVCTFKKCVILGVAIIGIAALAISITAIALNTSGDSDDSTTNGMVSASTSASVKGKYNKLAREYSNRKHDSVHKKRPNKNSDNHNVVSQMSHAVFNNGIGVAIIDTEHILDGKRVQAMYIFAVANSNTSRVNEIDPSSCIPPFTLGANLSVPSPGYSIYLQSATVISQSYAQAIITSASAVWDSLSLQPLLGGAYPWSGGAPNLSGPNGKNTVSFGYITPTNVLAYTITWGFFSNYPISQRRIVEWDIVIGDASNNLGDATVNPNVYDAPRIVMHEFGHSLGIGDIYTQGCAPYTIEYGVTSLGQVQPRVPQADDISAFAQLYPGVFNADFSLPSTSHRVIPQWILNTVLLSIASVNFCKF